MISFIYTAVIVLLSSMIEKSVVGLHVELTFLLIQNEEFCLHQRLDKDLAIDIDYFVVRGEPREIIMEVRSSLQAEPIFRKIDGDGEFKFNSSEADYRFCFDNRLSSSNNVKFVNFFITSNDEYFDASFKSAPEIYERKKDEIDLAIENSVKEVFDSVSIKLNRVEHFQVYFKHYDSLDRYIVESILDRVDFWSLFNTVLMVSASIFQVIFIQRFFKNQEAFRTLNKRI